MVNTVVVWLHILGPYWCMGSRRTAHYTYTMQNFDLGSVCLLVDVMRVVTHISQDMVLFWTDQLISRHVVASRLSCGFLFVLKMLVDNKIFKF